MRQKPIRRVTGYIWAGRYRNGELGYILPTYMSPNRSAALSELQREVVCGVGRGKYCYRSDFYRVKITLTPVRNKKGNYSVRRIHANG